VSDPLARFEIDGDGGAMDFFKISSDADNLTQGNIVTVKNGTGNFGIGTTSPWARLSVAGSSTLSTDYAFAVSNISSTTLFSIANNGQASSTNLIVGRTATTGALAVTGSATSTFANGIQLSGGCFRNAQGQCVGGGASDGAGATYVVAAYNSRNASYADYQADFTNDQVEINNAITAAYSSGRGGKVYLLEGNYRIATTTGTLSNTISIHMATGTSLIGSGPGTNIILASSTLGNIAMIGGSYLSS
jgi:hypothetical protein